ncbi:unnamed protein product [Blepharisma stoltei]|uniref:VWFA domain-containing protein n=1 Tax=Blepharisma stoltei TaxID=1481888 RepID=A0AAU9JW32_9CILI|nr:unnamed protein product [Blepharisma stoltei]
MANIVQGELIHLVGEYMAIKLFIPDFQAGGAEIDNLNVIIAIDRSGSMAGPPIQDAKGATLSLIQKFKKARIPVTLYLFNNRLVEVSSSDNGFDAVINTAENLSALGGTLFAPVIGAIDKQIKEKGMKSVFCIWLSDGQDNDGLAQLIPIMENFQKDMENLGTSIAVHSIGFSENHDATLLTALSQSGTKPGSFQYVPPGGRIPVAVNNIYELAFEVAIWARFISTENNASYKISIERSHQEDMYEGLIYISENDLEDCKIEVHKGSSVKVYELEYTRGDTDDFRKLVHLVTNFVSAKIIQILEMKTENQRKNLEEICPLIEEMNRRIDNLEGESRRLRIFQRKQCTIYFNAAKELFNCYYEIMRETSIGDLTNLQLAKLNNYAHKLVLIRNLEKKLAKESRAAHEMLNQTESNINEAVMKFNIPEIQQKYANHITEYGNCIISGKSWIDAIPDGDCFCMTLEIERPRDLLGLAYEIKIKKILVYSITADSFIDSALFETKAGQIIQGSRSYQNGVKPLPANEIIKGLPNEIINGIFPVYINEDHWQIAKEKIKPLIGWNVTVNVLGYEDQQLDEFPYMLYAKAIEDAQTDFQYFQLNLIRETCLALYRDNKDLFLGRLKYQFDEYLTNVSSRLPSTIHNNSAFLAKLLCVHQTGDFQKSEILFPYIFEEEFRRRIIFPAKITFFDFVIKMLDIDASKYIEKVESQGFSISYYAQKFLTELERVDRDYQYHAHKKFNFTFTGKIDELSPRAESFIDKIPAQMKPGGMLYKILHMMGQFGFPIHSSLESLGIVTNEQKLALVFQSIRDKREIDRKNSIARGEFVNIFDPDASLKFIQNLYTQAVRKEATAHKKVAHNIETDSNNTYLKAEWFARTLNLNEAAGLLLGTLSGGNDFPIYFKALMEPYTELPAQKAAMLTSGQYKTVKLIVTTDEKNKGFITWNPSNANLHKIWYINRNKSTKEEWFEAFPERAEHLEHKYLRLEGVFVPYSNPRKNVRDRRHWNKDNNDVVKNQRLRTKYVGVK